MWSILRKNDAIGWGTFTKEGVFHDPQSPCCLARHRQSRQRRSLNRFRRACEHALFIQNALENEKGTNPEELIAAAHAGCFTMAVAFQLQSGGFTPTELNTEAAVSLEPEPAGGFRIARSALTLRASIPNIDDATFQKLAKNAETGCPISKVLKAEITLDAKLV
jgi:osmotically inducible protein OsmC